MKKAKKSSGSSKSVTQIQLASGLSSLELKLKHHIDVKIEKNASELMHYIDVKAEKTKKETTSELMHYMDLKNEQLLSDFREMFADKTAQHDEKLVDHDFRLRRVEHKLTI